MIHGSDRVALPRTGSRPGTPLADVVSSFVFARLQRRAAVQLTAMGVMLHSPWSGQRTLDSRQQSELAALTDIADADDDAMPVIATAA